MTMPTSETAPKQGYHHHHCAHGGLGGGVRGAITMRPFHVEGAV